jgi:hypothetical protein
MLLWKLAHTRQRSMVMKSVATVLRLTCFVIKKSEQSDQEGTCDYVRTQIQPLSEISSETHQPSQ